MQEENKKIARIKKSQQTVLEELLQEIEKNFLTREHIKSRFLTGRNSTAVNEIAIIDCLDLIDAVRENFKTSLQFGDYRRAVRYLATLNLLCQKIM